MSRITNALAARLMRYGFWLPDSFYIRLLYRLKMGIWPNLCRPCTLGEKLQWLKIYDRNPKYTKMVDKFAVKDYVADIIGRDYIIPTLGTWDSPEHIEWESLPSQFVLKTTHGGGNYGVIICKDKKKFNRQVAVDKLRKAFKMNIYKNYREWPYKDVKPCIIAEKYIEPTPGMNDLPDYKWYCFNGEPKYCQVIQDRNSHETIDFFDTKWVHQDFVGFNPKTGPFVGFATTPPVRPTNLELQIQIAKALSKDIPFSRVDLFETGGNTYFGEITFYPASGIGVFSPEIWDYKLGELLTLPSKK